MEPKFLGRPFCNLVAVQAKLSMDKQKHERNKEVKEESTWSTDGCTFVLSDKVEKTFHSVDVARSVTVTSI